MSAHRIETTLNQDGKLVLEDLPFQAGDPVEVIISPRPIKSNGQNVRPLRGQPIQYENPTDPVAPEDWNAIR